MNVYDFDGTIYKGDSTRDFYFYLLSHYPKVIKYLPNFIFSAFKYSLGIISKTKMKENLYRFLICFNDNEIDKIVSEFWLGHKYKINNWYYDKKKNDDVIISASPRFILSYICKEFNVHLICSEVNKKNGDYIGINCQGDEKVRRFYEEFPNGKIDEFYSDSKSDMPLAQIAKKAYMVKNGKIKDWNINCKF